MSDKERLEKLRRLRELRARAASNTPDEQTLARANPNRGRSPMDAFFIAMGRGTTNLARGVGLVPQEDARVTSSYEQLENAYPIATGAGEISGEVAPFLGPGMAIGGIASTGGRVAASTLLGALEGALITRGKGGDTDETIKVGGASGAAAGVLEAAFPHISRLGGALWRRVRGTQPRGPLFDQQGAPTPEFQEVLDESGITLDALADDALSFVENQPQGANPAQVERRARFDSQGIPSTRGNITQDFRDVASEERLAQLVTEDAAIPLRELRAQQSTQFAQGIESMVDALGVPADVGETVKLALTGRLENLRSQKNELYSQIGRHSPEVLEMPLFVDGIAEAIPDPRQLRRASKLDGNSIQALEDLLVEYGINQSPEAIEAFTKSGGEVMPLSVGNFEEFRQDLNQLRGGGQTPGGARTAQFASDIIKALDSEIDTIDKALTDASMVSGSVSQPLIDARNIVRTMKTEFSDQDLVGKLIATKRDGVTPVIESSKVWDSVMGRSVPVERTQRLVKSLTQSGEEGRAALQNLQAATIMRVLDDTLRAPSRKEGAQQVMSFSQFVNGLNKIGDEKLEAIFSTNPQALTQLRAYRQTARDLTPDGRAIPKGSAPVIMDLMNRFGRTPGIAPIVDLVNLVIKAGSDERAIRRALNNSPKAQQTASMLQLEFPAIASSLGIGVALNSEDDN